MRNSYLATGVKKAKKHPETWDRDYNKPTF